MLPLMRILEKGDLKEIRLLTEAGALNINYALQRSTWHGYLEVVKYLVDHRADICEKKHLALNNALWNSHMEVVKYLCKIYLERYGVEWCLTSDFEILRECALDILEQESVI